MTTNKINNKKYIGQHTNLNDYYLGSGKILFRAVNKYGKENFEKEIIEHCHSQKELDEKERYWIKYYDAVKSRDFYNIHVGGCGGDTYSGRSEEEKIAFKKTMSNVTTGENNGMYGKNHSTESKEKMSKTKKLNPSPKFQSKEFKEKISKATKAENNPMFGKKHTKESKNKMSINSTGKTSGERNGMYGKSGEDCLNGKKIYQYLDGKMTKLIREFNSVSSVLMEYNLIGHSSLYKAMKLNKKYKGFYWSKERKV